MPFIEIETVIIAPANRVFDLARSIDLHQISAGNTHERAVSGKTSGLIEKGDEVTWEARHFGVKQRLMVEIIQMEYPTIFTDRMLKGAFKRFDHQHIFIPEKDHTRMIDVFDYTSPLGLLGKLADFLFLKTYMRRFIERRNSEIKTYAESDKWQTVPGMNWKEGDS